MCGWGCVTKSYPYPYMRVCRQLCSSGSKCAVTSGCIRFAWFFSYFAHEKKSHYPGPECTWNSWQELDGLPDSDCSWLIKRVRFFPRLWALALRLNDIEGVPKDEHSDLALAQRVIDEISRMAAVLMVDTKKSWCSIQTCQSTNGILLVDIVLWSMLWRRAAPLIAALRSIRQNP